MKKMMSYFICQWIILILCFFVVSPVWALTIFSDNFDSGANYAWGNETGEWYTAGGVYKSKNIPAYSSVTTFPNLTNFEVNVDIKNLHDGGIMLRSSDWDNGVALITGGWGGHFNGLYWHVKVNGSWGVPLNKKAIPGLLGSDVSLRIVVNGNTYSAYINGSTTPATILVNSQFSSGKVALYNNSAQAFDNFSISIPNATSVPEPCTLLLFGISLIELGFFKLKIKRG